MMVAPPAPSPSADADEIRAAVKLARSARRALQPERAVAVLLDVLTRAPQSAAALILLGRCYGDLRRDDDAIAAFDAAVAMKPDSGPAHAGRALARLRAGQDAAALADALRATMLDPDSTTAWATLGHVFSARRLPDLAAKAFRRAGVLSPESAALKGLLLQEQMTACQWDGIAALIADIADRIAAGQAPVTPFYWHCIAESSESLRDLARAASAKAPLDPIPARPRAAPDDRIRIGYVSGELSMSANALCMAGVFEAHDKAALDIVAFDNGVDDGSPLRRRVAASFTELVPVSGLSDRDLASAIADRGIDVLVNLNGFFGKDRSAMFRHRPAPVQVNYLGCPGTMGAPYMDYIVADATVIPASDRAFYDEKVVLLPDSYYPTDRARPIASLVVTREECGLPAEAFVFCCFNHCHKILPQTFDRWMRILGSVQNSVLWLLDANPAATANLRKAAAARGVDPGRLVFAPAIAPADHLARHRCADLFLDTLPYNAHTTAIDALWTGLPVLTLAGNTYPGRVAASQLRAIGLDDMIAADGETYVSHAIALASDRSAMAGVTARLAAHRLTTPLFDTARYTRHLEHAFRTMVDRHRRGLPPDHFAVTPIV